MAARARIPMVDLGPLESGSRQQLEETAAELYDAFTKVGFAYVKNHGVPQEMVDEAFSWSRKFFHLPQSVKDKVPHPPQGWLHRGWSGVGLEKTSQKIFAGESVARVRQVPDCKESFEIGSDQNPRIPNLWPPEDDIPGFRDFFTRFYDACYGVEVKLLRAIAVGLGLDETYFLDRHSKVDNQIRLLHYPPVEEDLLRAGKVERIGAHSDFGTMTLLFQDDVGGLEVEDMDRKGHFNPAPYVHGTLVVNIGDLLMRWSNDVLKSTLHRVSPPPRTRTGDGESESEVERDIERHAQGSRHMTKERYSIPYFICADGDLIIDCVPGCHGPDRPKKYAPIKCDDYMDARMNATY